MKAPVSNDPYSPEYWHHRHAPYRKPRLTPDTLRLAISFSAILLGILLISYSLTRR